MQKRAFLPGLAAKAVGFTAGKVLPKTLNAGYKGLIRPMARMVFKRPGLAITGAIMPSWIGGNINTARGKGLSSLPRSLPKFASARRDALHASPTQGEEMSDKKYPSIFYKIEGFEKMAAEAEAAHRLVKRALSGPIGKILGGVSSSADAQKSVLGAVLSYARDYVTPAKGVAGPLLSPEQFSDYVINLTNKLSKKLPLKTELIQSLRNMPAVLKIGLPIAIAYPFVHKAYKQYQENKGTDQSYNDMLKIYPELQKENPQNTRQYFDYIKQYSPTVAKNPHAAGAIVRRFASTGGIAMDNSVIKNLLEVEKVKSDSKPRHEGMLGTIGAMI